MSPSSETPSISGLTTRRCFSTRETNRVILSEDADFRGADPELRDAEHPGVLACDTGGSPGTIAAAVRRIERVSDSLSNTVWYVPGEWVYPSEFRVRHPASRSAMRRWQDL